MTCPHSEDIPDETVWLEWIPRKIVTFRIKSINKIGGLDHVQNVFLVILREKNVLKNHNFCFKFNLKYKNGKKHVVWIRLDAETIP